MVFIKLDSKIFLTFLIVFLFLGFVFLNLTNLSIEDRNYILSINLEYKQKLAKIKQNLESRKIASIIKPLILETKKTNSDGHLFRLNCHKSVDEVFNVSSQLVQIELTGCNINKNLIVFNEDLKSKSILFQLDDLKTLQTDIIQLFPGDNKLQINYSKNNGQVASKKIVFKLDPK